MIVRIPLFALLALAPPAMAQDSYTFDFDGNGSGNGTASYGTVPTEVYVEDAVEDIVEDFGIPLASGEEIIGVYTAPSVVWVPVEAEVLYVTPPYEPPVEIDQVTGLARNTPGWTGAADRPLGIGCFPQGVCADLND